MTDYHGAAIACEAHLRWNDVGLDVIALEAASPILFLIGVQSDASPQLPSVSLTSWRHGGERRMTLDLTDWMAPPFRAIVNQAAKQFASRPASLMPHAPIFTQLKIASVTRRVI